VNHAGHGRDAIGCTRHPEATSAKPGPRTIEIVPSCIACGEPFDFPEAIGHNFVREPDGRANYMQSGRVVHRCPDGEYVAPGLRAPAKPRLIG
jgi:hypothetical protein